MAPLLPVSYVFFPILLDLPPPKIGHHLWTFSWNNFIFLIFFKMILKNRYLLAVRNLSFLNVVVNRLWLYQSLSFQGFRLIINLVLPDYFEINSCQYRLLCDFLTIYIYGSWVDEVFNPILEKEEAKKKEESDKYWAKIEDDMKTKEGEKNTISEKESGMVSTLVVENEKWNWLDFIYYLCSLI